MEDKEKRLCFFEEIFLLADINMDIALSILFFTLNNVEINFIDHNIYWKSYIIAKILPITKRVELIGKIEFAAAILDLEYEAFIVHEVFINLDLDIYLSQRA